MTSPFNYAPFHLFKDNDPAIARQEHGNNEDSHGTSMGQASQYASSHAPGKAWQSHHKQAPSAQALPRQSSIQAPQQSSHGQTTDETHSSKVRSTNLSSLLEHCEHGVLQRMSANEHNLSIDREMKDRLSSHASTAHQTPQMHYQQPQNRPLEQQHQRLRPVLPPITHYSQQNAPANSRSALTLCRNVTTTSPRDAQQQQTSIQFPPSLQHSRNGEQVVQRHGRSSLDQSIRIDPPQQQISQSMPTQQSTTNAPLPQGLPQASQTVNLNPVYHQQHEFQRVAAPQAEIEAIDRPLESTPQSQQVGTGNESKTKTQGNSHAAEAPEAFTANNVIVDVSAAITLMPTTNVPNPNISASNKGELETQITETSKKMRIIDKRIPNRLAWPWSHERSQAFAKASKFRPMAPRQISGQKRRSTLPQPPAVKKRAGSDSVTEPPRPDTVVPTNTAKMSSALEVGSQVDIGTEWPPEKKGLLSQAAVSHIEENTRKQSKGISAAELLTMLGSPPKDVEKCRRMVEKGIKIDRETFAKHFLNRLSWSEGAKGATNNIQSNTSQPPVIEAPATQVKPSPAATSEPQSKSTSNNLGAQKRKSGTTPALSAGNSTQHASPTKLASVAGASGAVNPTLEGRDAVKALFDQLEGPNSVSATKAKGANKTALQRNSVGASATLQPPMEEQLARKRTSEDIIDLTLSSESESESESEAVLFPPAKRQDHGPISKAMSTLPSPPQPDRDKMAEVANETNAPNEVDLDKLRPRASQVPNITASSEPNRSSSLQPDATSQLSSEQQTGQSAAPAQMQPSPLPPASSEQQGRNVSLALPLEKSKAFRRSEYDARTIARDVLLACGRHPELRPLNYHLETLKQSVPGITNLSDLGTINWDIVDPGGPTAGSGAQLRPRGLADVGNEAEVEDDDDDDSVIGKVDGSTRGALGPAASSVIVQGQKPTHSPAPKNELASSGPGYKTPQVKTRPPKTASPGPASGGYAAFWQVDKNGNPIKKRGRPPGWRKWMQKQQGSSGKAPAGVKPKKPDSQPHFHVYKCEWRDCIAQLHNLDTLRSHVYKLHCNRNLENVIPCHWLNCGRSETTTDLSNGRTTSAFQSCKFEDYKDWKAHVENTHISPIAWKHGDGPAAGILDRDSRLSDAYLSDRQGRRVTPRIVMPDDTPSSSSTPVKRTAEEEARLEQDKAMRRKRDAGPGIDKGGARLANEKRRQGFIDNATEARIIEDDDDHDHGNTDEHG